MKDKMREAKSLCALESQGCQHMVCATSERVILPHLFSHGHVLHHPCSPRSLLHGDWVFWSFSSLAMDRQSHFSKAHSKLTITGSAPWPVPLPRMFSECERHIQNPGQLDRNPVEGKGPLQLPDACLRSFLEVLTASAQEQCMFVPFWMRKGTVLKRRLGSTRFWDLQLAYFDFTLELFRKMHSGNF